MKTFILILLIIPSSLHSQLFGSFHVGIINDQDGYTYIREGQEVDTPIIDTLMVGDFFLFIPSDSTKWLKVSNMWNSYGFVHSSKISPLAYFDRNTQRVLIDSIFKMEANIYLNQNLASRNYHDEKFIPILSLFLKYMKQDFDNNLLVEFIDILILESGSADETPPLALGYLYLYYPEQILYEIKKRKNESLIEQLLFGFESMTYIEKKREELE